MKTRNQKRIWATIALLAVVSVLAFAPLSAAKPETGQETTEASPALQGSHPADGRHYVPGEVLVRLKAAPASAGEATAQKEEAWKNWKRRRLA